MSNPVVVVNELQRAGLFAFSSTAVEEVDEFCRSWLAHDFEVSSKLQGVRELALISAAEFSLAPAFLDPLAVRPPYEVSRDDATIALLKSDTNMIIPVHLKGDPDQGLESLVSRNDISVFSADIAKLQLLAPGWWEEVNHDHDRVWECIEDLQYAHRTCPWIPARMVAASPLLKIQGLLWLLRLTISRNERYEGEVPGVVSTFIARYRSLGGGGEEG
ncbi:hypothetical protein [Kitasatospora griseola]|uniref:hypothetical protein n=1 Tax=Kitasatospora griseola TaxID=2064 RepID=UPI00166FB855|nr:hypothetical protein [Kitasatospora griseola]